MKTRVREIREVGDRLFSAKMPLDQLRQEIALNFYPSRADFTTNRNLGTDFASHLMSGFPVMARRELANALAAMLRSRSRMWLHPKTYNEKVNDNVAAKQWLERSGRIQYNAMYDREAQFIRATTEGDNDFVSFGQTGISIELSQDLSRLLYRCWHLRDIACAENAQGQIDTLHRKWKLPARDLANKFPKTVSDTVRNLLKTEPYREICCRHVEMPYDDYDLGPSSDSNQLRRKFVSLYIDEENETLLEEVPLDRFIYVVPRWRTLSGSAYSFSPATELALPDGRLCQQMTLALLEGVEKAVTPPMIGVQEAIRSDVNVGAGQITFVEAEYDEKTGEVLRPLTQDFRGINYGFDMMRDTREQIKDAFFLNKITLPELGPKMTAFEVQKRIEEYVRATLPLFEPMETEYNGAICENTFELLQSVNGFGPIDDMPPILRGQDIKFTFDSPLQAAEDRIKTEAFLQVGSLIGQAALLDPTVVDRINVDKAFDDALDGIPAPADWRATPDEIEAKAEMRAKEQQAKQLAATLSTGAGVAQQVGDATKSLSEAGLV